MIIKLGYIHKILFSVSLIILIFLFNHKCICQRQCTKLRDLSFGLTYPTLTVDIPVTNSNSAQFYIYTNAKKNLYITFALPSYLTSAGKPNIPITFDQNHTSYRKTTNNPVGSTYFNPFTVLTISGVTDRNVFYVWIGGIVTVPSGAPAGTYTATITITARQ